MRREHCARSISVAIPTVGSRIACTALRANERRPHRAPMARGNCPVRQRLTHTRLARRAPRRGTSVFAVYVRPAGPPCALGAEDTEQGVNSVPRMPQQCLHLLAAALAGQAPGAEVLAVVGKQVVIVLSQPRCRAPDHLRSDVAGLCAYLDAEAAAIGKARQGGPLNWPPAQETLEPRSGPCPTHSGSLSWAMPVRSARSQSRRSGEGRGEGGSDPAAQAGAIWITTACRLEGT